MKKIIKYFSITLISIFLFLIPVESNAFPQLYEVSDIGYFGILDFGIIPDVISIILNQDTEKLDLLMKAHRVVLLKPGSVFMSDSQTKEGIMFGLATMNGDKIIAILGPACSCKVYKPKNKKDKDA